MRLLYVVHQYYPAVGGAEKLVTNLAEAMVVRGHHVTVFTSRATDYRTWHTEALPVYEVVNGVHVHRFRAFERGAYTWRVLNFGLSHYWRTRSSLCAPFIVWGNGPVCPGLVWAIFTRAHQFDMVHVHNLHYATLALSYWPAQWRNLPYVLSPLMHIDQPEVFEVDFQMKIAQQADFILTLTSAEASYWVNHHVPVQKLEVTGHGLKMDHYATPLPDAKPEDLGLPANAVIVLFLARKERYKGLALTLEAFAKVAADFPEAWLIVAGPETNDSIVLQRKYADLPRAMFFDKISDATKQQLLTIGDVLMVPSEGESFGIVYLEAWAYGKPVIGARSGAVPSLITHGQDGLLITPNNLLDAEHALRYLLSNPTARAQMGAEGYRKFLAHYTIDKIADKTEAAYIRTLRQRRTM